MSTVVEAIYAKARGVKVCGISCITNMAAGMNADLLTHEDVITTADVMGEKISNLILKYIKH